MVKELTVLRLSTTRMTSVLSPERSSSGVDMWLTWTDRFISCEIQADMAPTDSSLCLPRQRGHCDSGRVQYWIAFLKILNDEK